MDRQSGADPRRPMAGSRTGRRGFLAGIASLGILGATGVASGRGQKRGSAAFEPLGTVDASGLAEVVVDENGTTTYGSLRGGFAVFDVSDPANPSTVVERRAVLKDVEGGPLAGVRDVKVDRDRLLVAGPNAGPGGDELPAFAVFDVSDPTNPTRTNHVRTGHAIHNAFLADGVAYCTGTGAGGEPLFAYDVESGERLGSWSVASSGGYGNVSPAYRSCHDVYVQDGVAYVAYWDAGTWLVDVSDPAEPTAIAQVGGVPPENLPSNATGRGFPPRSTELPGNSHYVQPNAEGDLLAVGKEAWDDEGTTDHDGGPGGIELWDVSDPESAQRLSIIAPPGEGDTAHNFEWRGDRLYASWYGGGVRVFDVADPTAPQLLASWADPETTSFWSAVPAEDCVVAASYYDPRNSNAKQFDGVGATLYTFPDPESGGSAAATMTPRSPRTPSPTPTAIETETSVETATGSSTPTGTPTETVESPTPYPPEQTRTTDPGTTAADDTGTSQPGFGIIAALLGGGIAAWRLRDGEDE